MYYYRGHVVNKNEILILELDASKRYIVFIILKYHFSCNLLNFFRKIRVEIKKE